MCHLFVLGVPPTFPPQSLQLVLPKEPGLERESISWFTRVYPRTRQPDWKGPSPIDLVQVIEGHAGRGRGS